VKELEGELEELLLDAAHASGQKTGYYRRKWVCGSAAPRKLAKIEWTMSKKSADLIWDPKVDSDQMNSLDQSWDYTIEFDYLQSVLRSSFEGDAHESKWRYQNTMMRTAHDDAIEET